MGHVRVRVRVFGAWGQEPVAPFFYYLFSMEVELGSIEFGGVTC